MLHALAAAASPREVWWLQGARDGARHVFAAEARGLLAKLPHGRGKIWFSRPAEIDALGRDYDAAGHLSVEALDRLGVPRDADFYTCGPSGFIDDLTADLSVWGVATRRIHSEVFAGRPSMTPGVVGAVQRQPHAPNEPAGAGPLVSFARSGLGVRWRGADESLLELAEACDVPVRWPAAPASVTTARAASSPAASPTTPNRLIRPLWATC